MGRRHPVLDPWLVLPGTGRESKGGELGGTSEGHEEGIPEVCASFHAQGQPRHCLHLLPHGQSFGAPSTWEPNIFTVFIAKKATWG